MAYLIPILQVVLLIALFILLLWMTAVAFLFARAIVLATLSGRMWNPTSGEVQIVSPGDPRTPSQLSIAIQPLAEHFVARGYSEIGRLLSRRTATLVILDIYFSSADGMSEAMIRAQRATDIPNLIAQTEVHLYCSGVGGSRICTTNSPNLPELRHQPDETRTLSADWLRDPDLLIALHNAHVSSDAFGRKPMKRTIAEVTHTNRLARERWLQRMCERREIEFSPDKRSMRHRWPAILSKIFGQVSPIRTIRLACLRWRAVDLLRHADVSDAQIKAARKWDRDLPMFKPASASAMGPRASPPNS